MLYTSYWHRSWYYRINLICLSTVPCQHHAFFPQVSTGRPARYRHCKTILFPPILHHYRLRSYSLKQFHLSYQVRLSLEHLVLLYLSMLHLKQMREYMNLIKLIWCKTTILCVVERGIKINIKKLWNWVYDMSFMFEQIFWDN